MPYSPFSKHAARQDPLLVEHDRVDHFDGRHAGRVVGAAGLQQSDDLGATVGGALLDCGDPVGRKQFGDRNAGDRGIAGQRHHRVAVTAKHHRGDIFDRNVQFHRDERAEAGRVQHTGHADHPLAWETSRIEGDVAHGVKRIRDDDDDRVGRTRDDLTS